MAKIREIQKQSIESYGVGFTEFVPLSFVAKEAPIWKNNKVSPSSLYATPPNNIVGNDSKKITSLRSGPTGNEVILTHAVARLMFSGYYLYLFI